jgi:ADP-ribose pyrophosphatase YjhB (NUDIX family)
MSTGIIAYRANRKTGRHEYLMIRRKESLGYIDFMRGKYSVYDRNYILNMMTQMTTKEKRGLLTGDFEVLWRGIWGAGKLLPKYRMEEIISRDKFKQLKDGILPRNGYYSLDTLINETQTHCAWQEPEWGFPKGRRNGGENDYDCAVREFCEETGYPRTSLRVIQNIVPYEEIFTGSNYVSYKHRYFVSQMKYDETLDTRNFQKSEVSRMEWFSIDKCLEKVRPYNLERIRIIQQLDACLARLVVS